MYRIWLSSSTLQWFRSILKLFFNIYIRFVHRLLNQSTIVRFQYRLLIISIDLLQINAFSQPHRNHLVRIERVEPFVFDFFRSPVQQDFPGYWFTFIPESVLSLLVYSIHLVCQVFKCRNITGCRHATVIKVWCPDRSAGYFIICFRNPGRHIAVTHPRHYTLVGVIHLQKRVEHMCHLLLDIDGTHTSQLVFVVLNDTPEYRLYYTIRYKLGEAYRCFCEPILHQCKRCQVSCK